jgi:hypothetical protein
MDAAPRHYCRNPRCRMKLPAPVENEHHAFCTRGCFESFYLNRCRVCERDLRKDGKRGDAGRLYCRPPTKCRQEAKRWPEKYEYGSRAAFSTTKLRSAHSTGLKFGLAGYPPERRCLRGWWWGDPGIGDLSLYDDAGITHARIVLDNEYDAWLLRSPITWPRKGWATLEEARRGAEAAALAGLALDPKIAARVAKENETTHPMGPPLDRPWPIATGDAIASDWKPTGSGVDMPGIPDFLRRQP